MPRFNGTLIGLGILVATLVASPAHAVSNPGDFCSGNPCTVSGVVNADAGSVVDFAGRDLILDGSARIVIGPGALPRILTLRAESITMAAGSEIRGFDADRAVVTLESTSGDVTLQSAGTNRAEIDVRADVIDAGSIIIRSAGDAIIGGRLTASANGEDATGGTIEIDAVGAVTISEEATTTGNGSFAGGGDINVVGGGNINITNKMFAEGADFGGGDVAIRSTGGDITIGNLMSNNGGDPDGEAGEFTFDTPGTFHLTSNGEIRGKGGSGADDDCGDGAPTFIDAAVDIIIDGLVDTKGGFQCFGGDIAASAGRDWIQNGNGKVSTETGGGFGAGGPVDIAAARSATTLQIDASSAGFGGDITITTGLFIDVLDKLNSRATGAEGVGARVMLQSCTINVLAPDGELDARGPFAFAGFGKNILRLSGTGTFSGKFYAATENEIRTLGPVAPVFTGVTDPPFIVIPDPTLPMCANSCGDGNTTPPEVCDDGGINSCDGCSPDCTRLDDVCGDGIVECGEQCDDGNAIPGDGCENDCTPTGQSETGVLIQGTGKKVGCQAEWLVQVTDPDTTKKGLPSAKQICIDGDFRCDADGVINNSCSIMMSPCFNVPDDDLPECDPGSRVDRVILKKPLPGSNNAQDDANAQSVVASLLTLGTQVEADGSVLSTGGPISGTTVCGPAIEAVIPFSGKSGKKTFKLRTENEAGLIGKKGQIQLKCERNNSVCGNSEVEPGEACDDGNALSCDGCSSCRLEVCGNGTVECDEQCDEGELNGTEGSRCSSTCQELAPDLRIPGGGSKKTDCMWQWSMDIGAGDLLTDKRGVARNKQTCRDGNALCDFDPTPGNCRVRVYGCAGAANPDISCAAQAVDSFLIKRPKSPAKKDYENDARAVMDSVLGAMPFPVSGSEVCSTGMFLDVPVDEKLRLTVKATGVKRDSDSLRIICE